jgi:pimeloyl-ACP methyl ester carboxylesterase
MPVLAIGGERSFGATEAAVMRNVAIDVREAVVPGASHWMIEENPNGDRCSHPRLPVRNIVKDEHFHSAT